MYNALWKRTEADDFDETCRSGRRRLSWILNAVKSWYMRRKFGDQVQSQRAFEVGYDLSRWKIEENVVGIMGRKGKTGFGGIQRTTDHERRVMAGWWDVTPRAQIEPSRTPRTSSTTARSARKGHMSVSSVSCGSLNHVETGTALFGWKM